MHPPIPEPFDGEKINPRVDLSPVEWLCASGAAVGGLCAFIGLINFVLDCIPRAGQSGASLIELSYRQNIGGNSPLIGVCLLSLLLFFLLRSQKKA